MPPFGSVTVCPLTDGQLKGGLRFPGVDVGGDAVEVESVLAVLEPANTLEILLERLDVTEYLEDDADDRELREDVGCMVELGVLEPATTVEMLLENLDVTDDLEEGTDDSDTREELGILELSAVEMPGDAVAPRALMPPTTPSLLGWGTENVG